MKNITATQARKDIYNLIEAVEANHEPIQISSKRSNAVLIAESDWRAIQETLYLLSVPDMRESIQKGLKTSLKKCKEDIDW